MVIGFASMQAMERLINFLLARLAFCGYCMGLHNYNYWVCGGSNEVCVAILVVHGLHYREAT